MKTTGFSRVSKDLIIKEIEKEIKSRPILFVTQHGTTPSNKLDKLRTKLRTTKSRYMAVKNSLGKIALERANHKDMAQHLTGASGLVFTSGDPVQSSKILVDFAKENEAFKIQQAYMNGENVSLEQIRTLATLPSREVLLGRVAGGMLAPISRFVNVLSGTLRQLVTVLDGVAKKKQ